MSVQLRLSRHGAKKRPFYHIVATDHRSARNGSFIEKLGTYDPSSELSKIEVKEDRVRFWYDRGAELSGTVSKLFKAKKIKLERAKTNKPKKAKA